MHPWGEEVSMDMQEANTGSKQREYLAPGVYVEEVPAANKPIEGVGTSVAAFVGLSPFSPARLARTFALAAVLASVLRRLR
jgi:hypothetical protein